MKTAWLLAIVFCCLLFRHSALLAQEHEHEDTKPHQQHHEFKHHRISAIIGHGHVFGAENVDNGKKIVTIPTWGFDYQYWFNDRYGLSLKTDIEIMEYVVKLDDEGKTRRKNPLIVSTVFLFHPSKGWNLFAGPGIEFEESHNLFVLRAGVGYEFHIGNHWDFAPEVIFDLKDGTVGAFTWGIGVGKRF